MSAPAPSSTPLHYRRHGPVGAAPLVLLHSLGGNGSQWDAVADALGRRGFATLALDLRGHGRSPTVPGDDAIPAHADAVAETLGLLGGPPPALVAGVSFGGLVALSLALRHPRLAPRLALIATDARIGTPETWRERIALVESQGLPVVAPAIIRRWFSPSFAAAHPSALTGAATALAAGSPVGYLAACRALASTDLSEQLPQIAVPALVVAGGADPVVPPDSMRRLASALPAATYVELPGLGHLPPLEAPAQVASLLSGFAPPPAS